MDLDEARSFIGQHHRAVLTTIRPSGRPQMSPVLVAVDDAGRAVISSRETAFKVHHLRRDPRVSLCVLSDDFWKWIQVDGTASILSLPEGMEPLVDYYRRVSGEHPDWDEYRRAMVDQKRVLIVVDIDHAGPDRQG